MKEQNRPAWIAVTIFISLFFLWGGGLQTAPVFYPALLKSFGWSHAYTASIASALSLSVAVMAPVVGWLLDRVGARVVMTIGTALAGSGLLLAGRSNGYRELLLANVILGIGLGASAWIPATIVISNWFDQRQGTMLGVTLFGKETGGMLLDIVVGYFIAVSGWRTAYTFLALPILFVVLPLMISVIRTRAESVASRAFTTLTAVTMPGMELREALMTRSFWLLLATYTFGMAQATGVGIHLVAYLMRLGYTQRTGTMVISLLIGTGGFGKVGMGILGERIGSRNAMVLSLLVQMVGIGLLLFASQSLFLLLFLLVYGATFAAHHVLVPLTLKEVCGLKRFGTLFGWIGASASLGLFAGPLLVGWATDYTGSYRAAYAICMVLCLLGAGTSLFSVPFRKPKTGELLHAGSVAL